jgi:hypothetical protein
MKCRLGVLQLETSKPSTPHNVLTKRCSRLDILQLKTSEARPTHHDPDDPTKCPHTTMLDSEYFNLKLKTSKPPTPHNILTQRCSS